MKILLVAANRITEPYPVYPLGLDHVAGHLEDEHELRVVDLCAQEGNDTLIAGLAEFQPELVGISVRNVDNQDFSDSKDFIPDLCEVVRCVRQHSEAQVVLGGSGFTIFPEALLEATGADWGLLGEGERLGSVLQALKRGEEIAGLDGVVMPGERARMPAPWQGKPRRTKPGRYISLAPYLPHGGMFNLQTQRGCPFNCSYCTYPRIEGHRLRAIDAKQVAAWAMALQEAGAKYLFLADAVFNVDEEHGLAVAEAMHEAGVRLPWGAFFAPLRPKPDTYARLAAAGCTHVEFGTDALADVTMKAYGKRFSYDDVLAAHKAARSAGLHVAHYLVLGGPGETEASMEQALERAEHLDGAVLIYFCGVRVYPHTRLFDQAVAGGLLAAHDSLIKPWFFRAPGMEPDAVMSRVAEAAAGRPNWILGSGGPQAAQLIKRLHSRGRVGPLWELLAR